MCVGVCYAPLALGSVEAVEGFFGVVDFGEDGVLFEPILEAKAERALQAVSVLQQEASDRQRPFIASNFFSVAIDGWV